MGHLNMSLLNSGLVAKIKPPTVLSVTPDNGPAAGGTPIVVAGTNFQVGASFSIDGVPCTSVVVTSKTSLTAVTGAHAIEADLDGTVTNPAGGDGHSLSAVGVEVFSYT